MPAASAAAARVVSMSKSRVRSIGLPIVLGSVAVVLTVALLVGWTLVLVQNLSLTSEVAQNVWLLVAGSVSFCVVLSVVVLFSVFLVREILEVRRQYTFIDSVTHELKSPLSSLRLCLETMARQEITHEQREQLRQMMLSDVDRLSEFVDSILEASRIQHGRRGYLWSEIDVADLGERCVAGIARRYSLPADAITVDIPHGLSLVTDVTALETALKNLLDNAVKYSPAPVHVRLAAAKSDGFVDIDVHDHGIGIPKKHLRRISERFYRVPTEEVYARRGTGLGLFVVASLVRGLGGRLSVQSPGEGCGTHVHLRLPAALAAGKDTLEVVDG